MLTQCKAVFYETLSEGWSTSLTAGAVCCVINKIGVPSRRELYGTLRMYRMIMKSSDRDGVTTYSFTLKATNCYSSPSSPSPRNTKLIFPYWLPPECTYIPMLWLPGNPSAENVRMLCVPSQRQILRDVLTLLSALWQITAVGMTTVPHLTEFFTLMIIILLCGSS